MPLALSFPAERTAPPKDLEIRPKRVLAWIESLPLSQVLDTTRKLTIHLAALNRAKLDLDARLQILEAYRPVCATALDELESTYERAPLPLAPRARESLLLARDLASEMAIGFKIALVERGSRRLPFGGRKQLPLLLSRAMEYLVAGLVASYKSYTPVPVGTWRELHEIFLHADAEGVGREEADADSAAVFDLYGEALLLSLTDPYRLVQGELERIRALSRSWRGAVTLTRTRPPTKPGGHFIVPCDTDRPPKPMLSANDDAGGPNWRLLDTNAVVDKLRARKQAVETGNVSATMAKAMGPEGMALAGRLMTLWGDPPKRAFRRNTVEGSVAICVGLRAVGHFVSFEPRMDPRAEAEALRKGITMPIMALPTDDASQAIPVFEWDVVNESAGGLKVRRMGATQQPIGVGEVVGIKFIDRTRWTIGVVRWITLFEEGGMEFGIQFLGSMATPVWVQPTITSSPQAKFGLLLAVGQDGNEADSLLTPPNTFSDLREFEVDQDGTVSRVRAASLIEKTGRFELFHFSAA
jgi:hypothetical protein